MFKFKVLSLILCLLLVLSFSFVAEASIFDEIENRGTIRIAINSGVEPFTYLDDDGNPTGLCVELGELVGEKMGVEVEFMDMDWGGLIPALLAGRVDIIGDRMSNTLERAKSVSFTDPYLLTGTIAYTRTDTPFEHADDLNEEGVTVGVIMGAVGESVAEEKLPNAEVIPYDHTADCTEALLAGRVDAVLEDDIIAYSEVEKDPDNMRVLPGYLMADSYSFATRQEDTELIDWMNLFFERIKRSSEFGDLHEKWLEMEWDPEPQKQL